MYRSKPFTRREALKLGALGSAGLLLPLERFAGAAGGASANRMPVERPAGAVQPARSRTPPVLSPVRTDATTDYYRLVQQQALVEILPGKQTTIFGYNGITPGPTIMAQRDRPVVVQQINALPAGPSDARLHAVHVDAPARVGVAAGVRRLRQRRDHSPGSGRTTTTRTTSTRARSGTTTTRVGITAENAYIGPRGAVPAARRPRAEPRAAAAATTTCRSIIKDAMFAKDGSLIFDDQRPLGALRRRHPRQRRAVAARCRSSGASTASAC